MSTPPSPADVYREQLYDIRANEDATPSETMEAVLELGCEYLGVENGHVKRIDEQTGTHEVIATHGIDTVDVAVGDTHEHARTYCRLTVDRRTPVAIAHASEEGYEDDPAYIEHELECYLGTSFSVGGTLYGTVCFVSRSPRPDWFCAVERSFAELAARTVSDELAGTTATADTAKNRALEDASIAISIADSAGDPARFTYVNRQFEQLTGYGRDDLHGETFSVLCGPETDRDKLRTFRQKLDDDTLYQDDICLYRKDGSPLWVRLTATPVTDETGQTTNYVAFYQNITQRRRNERLLAVLNRVVRHNIRNEVSIIEGYAHQLATRGNLEESQPYEKIRDAVADLENLSYTASTLEQCRQAAEEPDRIDVVPLVSDVVDRLRADYSTGTLSLSVPAQQQALATHRLTTALEELGTNAIEHAGLDPTVEFTVEDVPEEHLVKIAVSDDGPGLPEPDQRTLEGRPETPLEHGSGLGLFLVYWIVTSHGGYISVSVEDGTTVELYLRTAATQPGNVPATVTPPDLSGD